jgi:hypothetical protein
VGKGGMSGTRHVLLLKWPHRSLRLWSKFSLFLKSFCFRKLEFKHTSVFYYRNQQSLALQGRVPSPKGWGIAQIVVNTLGLVVQQCVLNQTWNYWFFSNALATSISFICQMWVDSLTPNSSEAMTLMVSLKSYDNTCKNRWYKFWIPSFHL